MAPELARHLPASGIGSLMAYWRFYRAVAAAQLAGWLAASVRRGGELLVDMSGPHLSCADQAAAAGHTVIHVVPADLPGAPVAGPSTGGGAPALNSSARPGGRRPAP